MTSPSPTEFDRRSLFLGIQAQMKLAADRWRENEAKGNDSGQKYWVGVEDGLNKVYRYLLTGEWRT